MKTWSRRRTETLALAIVASAALVPLRYFVEARIWFLAEWLCLLTAMTCLALAKSKENHQTKKPVLMAFAAAAVVLTPAIFAFVARFYGSAIAFEMSALATFGAAAFAIALCANSNRLIALSLVISGFLVLFCGSISDHQHAAVIPLIWMLGCVWHLIANRWETLDLASPVSVERTWAVRPAVLGFAILLLAGGGYAAKDRWKSSRITNGWMPTSGGNNWTDPGARSGVGTGTAAIAAKDHAESFGAVDSELFLESKETSLFDMVNDLIGEPKGKKKNRDRAQALDNEKLIKSHARSAKSERGSATFSTERLSPKKHHHFEDATTDAVVQWDGPTGIRLAMQRYDKFDGRDWSQSRDLHNESLSRLEMGDAAWFLNPSLHDELDQHHDALSIGLLKVLRLDSPRLPAPMGTVGVHIEKITREDFFGITKDGCFYMPGREKVPSLSVVHLASIGLTEDEIRSKLGQFSVTRSQRKSPLNRQGPATTDPIPPADDIETTTPAAVEAYIEKLVDSVSKQHSHPLDQLNACIEKLRAEFIFSRDPDSSSLSLEEFFETRSGGDHLFATTAALIARELGLESRLATGFYVRPEAYEHGARHSAVLPTDVHFWMEVRLDNDIWFELEPTPGYQPPYYSPSLRLRAARFLAAYWPAMLAASALSTLLYLTRRVWVDWLLAFAWMPARWLNPRYRYRVAMGIIEARAKLAGQNRPIGISQRAWLEQLTHTDANLAGATQRFVDAADRLFFGHPSEKQDLGDTRLVQLLRVATITALNKDATP